MAGLYYRLADDGATPIAETFDQHCERLRKHPREPGCNRVKRDAVNGVVVSTIFLEIDHAWNGGPPVLWETYVFPADDQGEVAIFCEIDGERYTSHADAIAGHTRYVDRALAGEFKAAAS